jgi:hypothetical protein
MSRQEFNTDLYGPRLGSGRLTLYQAPPSPEVLAVIREEQLASRDQGGKSTVARPEVDRPLTSATQAELMHINPNQLPIDQG